MTRSKWIAIVALTLLVLAPLAMAGEGKDCGDKAAAAKDAHASKKCSYGTQDCLDHMAAKMKTGGWVGIELERDETTGVMTVQRVVPGSPAAAAGLKTDDLIMTIAGQVVRDANDFRRIVESLRTGAEVVVEIKRKNDLISVRMTPVAEK